MALSPAISSKSSALVTVLDASSTVLTVMSAAAQFVPFPYIQQLCSLVLTIVDAIKDVKDNKAAFKLLAQDACDLVAAIVEVVGELPTLSSGLKRNLDKLLSFLRVINDFALENIARNGVSRVLRRATDASKIKEYRRRIQSSLNIFGLKAQIRTHENVVEILRELRARGGTSTPKIAQQQTAQAPPNTPTPDPSADSPPMTDTRESTRPASPPMPAVNPLPPPRQASAPKIAKRPPAENYFPFDFSGSYISGGVSNSVITGDQSTQNTYHIGSGIFR
ncbi:hypothetical protein C8J57DRAFT_142425 [Mycena rebaudengoi]|nr:hypothetical protein C8J57DRAFT_142425 [Mycena rebaudengoi]